MGRSGVGVIPGAIPEFAWTNRIKPCKTFFAAFKI
jgi:hypothetical protein